MTIANSQPENINHTETTLPPRASGISRRAALMGLGSLIACGATGFAQDAASPAVTAPPVISQQSLRGIRDASQRLMSHSRESFDRGLVPLVDHLDQVSLAASLNLRVAASQNNRESQLQWHRLQVRNLEGVAAQLDRFQQPASAGWEADALLARLSLAQAQSRLATFEGRAGAAVAAQRVVIDLARQHWDKRMADAEVGHATPLQLQRAVGLVFSSENRPLEADRNSLTQALQAVDRWHLAGSGIGREDVRDTFRFELARVNLQSVKPGTDAFNTQALRAEASAAKLFDTVSQFQSQGTASLYDLAAVWRQRQELHAFVESSRAEPVPAEWKQRRSADLGQISRLAAQTSDRRGRVAADLSYVELLSLADQTVTRQTVTSSPPPAQK